MYRVKTKFVYRIQKYPMTAVNDRKLTHPLIKSPLLTVNRLTSSWIVSSGCGEFEDLEVPDPILFKAFSSLDVKTESSTSPRCSSYYKAPRNCIERRGTTGTWYLA